MLTIEPKILLVDDREDNLLCVKTFLPQIQCVHVNNPLDLHKFVRLVLTKEKNQEITN